MPVIIGSPPDSDSDSFIAGSCYGVCTSWTTIDRVRRIPGDLDPLITDEDISEAILAASDILFELSGRQWAGSCEDVVRPAAPCMRCSSIYGLATSSQMGSLGISPYDAWNYSMWSGCRCGGYAGIDLGVYPLNSITQMLLDGEVVDPSGYRIDNRRYLLRMADADGNPRRWPCCQRFDLAPTEIGTWQATYTYGAMPPTGGIRSASLFARELALALAGSKECKLPGNVQSVQRSGVSFVVYPKDLIASGKTGIPSVDIWLHSVNPLGIRQSATILSPDSSPIIIRPGS